MSYGITYRQGYRYIQDGEEVKANVANRPLDDLYNNIEYLKNVIESSGVSSALVLRNQIISNSSLTVGTPVYRRSDGVWTPARARLSSVSAGSFYTLADEAYVAGVVIQNNAPSVASICLQGAFTTDASILSIIESAYKSGAIYYLSMLSGGLTCNKTAIPIRVGIITGPDSKGNYLFIVNPDQRSVLETHTHIKLTLNSIPAGTVNYVPKLAGIPWGEFEPEGPFPGVIHQIVDEDPNIAGWLPATSSVFDGKTIPIGAKFGYNIEADELVKNAWPPISTDYVYIEENGITLDTSKVVVNNDGIWWMDDTYGNAPWPTNWPAASSSDSSSYPIWEKNIIMWVTRIMHSTSVDALNSYISVKAGSGLSLVPHYIGSNVEIEPIINSYITGYKFYSFKDTSSSSSGEDALSLIYTAGTEAVEFSRYREVKIGFRLLFFGGASSTNASVGDLIDSCKLKLVELPYSNVGTPSDITYNEQSVTIDTTNYIVDTAAKTGNKKLYLITNYITLSGPATLYLKLTWEPSERLAYSANEYIYLADIKPIISVA